MLKYLALAATLAACGGVDPLGNDTCRNSLDCDTGDWCVSRIDGQQALAAPLCLPPCGTDGDCASGACVAIGDASGPAVSVLIPHVCAGAAIDKRSGTKPVNGE